MANESPVYLDEHSHRDPSDWLTLQTDGSVVPNIHVMTGHCDDKVAIASGTTTRVAGWVASLCAAGIHVVTASSCGMLEEEALDYVELWVHEKDADRARSILRDVSVHEELLW